MNGEHHYNEKYLTDRWEVAKHSIGVTGWCTDAELASNMLPGNGSSWLWASVETRDEERLTF